MTTAAPTKHAKLSPSKSSTWIACPFSIDAPSLPAGEAAQDGTIAHGWASDVLLHKKQMRDVPGKYFNGVEMYVAHVQSTSVPPLVERYWESFTIDNFGGTVDALLFNEGICAVYDFKFGKWPVDAKDNSQLLCYSVLAAEHFDIKEFHGVIVQPNAFKGDKIKPAEYTPEQVDRHREAVIRASESREKKTGEHCRWCSFRTLKQCEEGVAYGKMRNWK
jgi:hypothetical protein